MHLNVAKFLTCTCATLPLNFEKLLHEHKKNLTTAKLLQQQTYLVVLSLKYTPTPLNPRPLNKRWHAHRDENKVKTREEKNTIYTLNFIQHLIKFEYINLS